MELLHKDPICSFFQSQFVFVREGSVASFDKIMVEGGVGVLRRTDGHNGEVEVVDGGGGDRGGNRVLLPLLVGLANQDSSSDETKADDDKPQNLRCLGLKKKNNIDWRKTLKKTHPS